MEKARTGYFHVQTEGCINFLCVDFFESRGITPDQAMLDACEVRIEEVLQQQLQTCI